MRHSADVFVFFAFGFVFVPIFIDLLLFFLLRVIIHQVRKISVLRFQHLCALLKNSLQLFLPQLFTLSTLSCLLATANHSHGKAPLPLDFPHRPLC